MKDEASYVCNSCGEEIVLPIDLSAGSAQEDVEDCRVCCRPNVSHVESPKTPCSRQLPVVSRTSQPVQGDQSRRASDSSAQEPQ